MRLAHFADSHLAASGNLLDASGLNAALLDRYNCTRFVFEDGLQRGADLFVGAGDLFNSPKPTPTERRLAIEAMQSALDARRPVLLLLGNHEATRNPQERHALDTLRDIDGLTIVDRPGLLNVWAYPGDSPYAGDMIISPILDATADGRDLVLQLACLPYPSRNLLLRDEEARGLDPSALNLRVRELTMDILRGLAAHRVAGVPCLAVIHAAIDTAEAGKQNSLAMLSSEWTLNTFELADLGFDGVLLGHYHRGQLLEAGPSLMLYSGSPEATAFGEEGEEKHYLIWSVTPSGAEGAPPDVHAMELPTPYRRMHTLYQSDFGTESGGARRLISDERVRGCIVRLELPSTLADRVPEYRRLLIEGGAHEVRVTVERAETMRRRAVDLSEASGLEPAVDAWLAQRPELQPEREALLEEARRVEEQMGGAA